MEKSQKPPVKRILKWICLSLVLLLFLTAIVPYIPTRKVGEDTLANLSKIEYYADTQGPDRVLLVETTQDALNARLELVRAAVSSLDMAYHTMHQSATTDAFLGEVLLAADRGVTVRILVDGKTGFPSSALAHTVAALNEHENISVMVYNPLRLYRPWEWQALLHDKFIIADGRMLLLGGRNIGDRYFPPEGYSGDIVQDRDVLVVSTGPDSVLEQAQAYMELLWTSKDVVPYQKGKAEKADLDALRQYPTLFLKDNPQFAARTMEDYRAACLPTNKVTLLANPINAGKKEPVIAHQLALLAGHGSSIVLQTPYATANKKILSALSAMARRGQAVMLTNTMATSPNYPAFSNYASARKQFINTGVQIYEYQSTDSIHGKSLVIDGRLSAVGSLNLDDRSIYLDTETMLVIDSEPFAESLLDAIGEYLDTSLAVGADNKLIPKEGVDAPPVGVGKRVLMFLASIFSRLFQFLI